MPEATQGNLEAAPEGTADVQIQTAQEGIAEAMAEAKAGLGEQPAEPPRTESRQEPEAKPDPAPKQKREANGKLNLLESESGKAAPESDGDADPEASKPITDWTKVKLDLPDGAQIDQGLLDSFGTEVAVKLGLSQKQANAVVNFQLRKIAEFQEAQAREQTTQLQKLWGANELANKQKVVGLLHRVCQQKGCEDFARAFGESGASGDARVLNGMLAICRMFDEDGTGPGVAAGTGDEPQDALTGIKEAFARARAGRG